MQRSGEEFHHQIFTLIIDRAVLKEIPKFAHVIVGTFSIGVSESREPIFIKGGHFFWDILGFYSCPKVCSSMDPIVKS
jgi:hypothetical protein